MLSIVLIVVQSAVPLTTLVVFKLLVDRLSDPAAGNPGDGFEMSLILIGTALLANVIGVLCGALLRHANTAQGLLVAEHMQRIVQAKSVEIDLAYYENSQFFDKLHRAQREAPGRPMLIIGGLTGLARDSLTLIGAMTLLVTFHWLVAAAVFAASVPVFYYRIRHTQELYDLERKTTSLDRNRRYVNQLLTTADSAKELRVFGFGSRLMQRYGDFTKSLRNGLFALSAQGSRQQFVTEAAAATAGFASLAFIVHSTLRGAVSLGELVMYFGAFQVAIGSLRPTLSGLAGLYENNLFLTSLYEFLEVPRSVPDAAVPAAMPRPWRKGLRVENLSFRYPGTRRLVLEGVDLTIRPGEIVALVGNNGSGKTTLTKLLCRLYDPSAGRITIDGIDIKEFATDALRRQLSVIYQDFGRYHMSVRDNILLGSPDLAPDDPSIAAAAKWSGIHDEIMALPEGYDTVLSRSLADGEELSIGQWQKVALARAFVRDSQLIVLDEPTSSLDAAAEFAFFEKFREMAGGRSALIISHRFSTVRLADRVYVLDGGRVIENGTHDALTRAGGLYSQLYRKQASYYDTVAPSELPPFDLVDGINGPGKPTHRSIG